MSISARPDAYALDNNDVEAVDRHNHLSAILDEFTFSRLSSVGALTGRRCLEVGAGGGSVARWLAERVGPEGQVVATDINTRHLSPDCGYAVMRHDLTTESVPDGPWDLIHTRLVLIHLAQRHEILNRLAASLAPGGALVVEEWDATIGNFVLAVPDDEAAALLDKYQTTLRQVFAAGGNDPAWGRRVHSAMIDNGLVNVDTVLHARSWPGGTPGALLITANTGQLRDEFLAAGMSGKQLDALSRLANDPRMVLRGHVLFSTIGRRPPTEASRDE